MLRSTRPLLKLPARGIPRASASIAPFATSQIRKHTSSTPRRAQLPTARPSGQLVPLVQRAYYANDNVRDKKFEKEVAQQKLESHPEQVTQESSTRASFEGPQIKPSDPPTSAGVKKDLVCLSWELKRHATSHCADHSPLEHAERDVCPSRSAPNITPARPRRHSPLPRNLSRDNLPRLGPEHGMAVAVPVREPFPDEPREREPLPAPA